MQRTHALVALLLVGIAGFGACKLQLDAGLIDKKADAGGGGGSGGSGGGGVGGAPDSGPDAGGGSGGTTPDAGACDADPQCKIDAGCVEGVCQSGKCAYRFCPAKSACEGRACSANKCATATSYGFGASSFALPADVGCNGSAARCIAALDNFVFVSTSDGQLLGYRTDDPASPTPITVAQPTFTVNRLVAAEGRLLALSTAANGTMSLAWFDVPADPLATQVTATNVTVSIAQNPSQVHPASGNGFFLTTGTAATGFPTALITPPISGAGATLTLYPNQGLDVTASVVASSGARLVAFRVDTSGPAPKPVFSLLASAGTSNAQAGTEQPLALEVPAALGAHAFASGYDGSVLWLTNRVFHDDAGTALTNAVVLRWPLAGTGDSFDGSLEVDVATYPDTDAGTALRGPMALIDANTAIVSATNASNPTQTVVRAVTKSGGSLSLAPGSALLAATVGQVGMAANRKYGFALVPGGGTERGNPVRLRPELQLGHRSRFGGTKRRAASTGAGLKKRPDRTSGHLGSRPQMR